MPLHQKKGYNTPYIVQIQLSVQDRLALHVHDVREGTLILGKFCLS